MRAITRSRLAPLFVAAAILTTAGLSAHLAAAAPPHRTALEYAHDCPAGTNWDDGLQECV